MEYTGDHNSEGTPPLNYVRIYCYGDPDGKTIKIGKTTQQGAKRKKQHEQRGPDDVLMRLLFEVWGQGSDESSVKNYFKHLRRPNRHEWLQTDDECREWLRYVRNLNFVATEEGEIEELPLEPDPRKWLPQNVCNRRPNYIQDSLDFGDNDDPWSDLVVSEIMEGDFYTSQDLVPGIHYALNGPPGLDPASCKPANRNIGATKWFGVKEDGLRQQWSGTVFVNPPFGGWKLWVNKIISEWHSGRVPAMLVLAPSRASTSQEFHRIIQECDAFFWPCGRYKFHGPKAKDPDEGHFIFYFGSEAERFADGFRKFGTPLLANRL
jgi:hypothetical protein